MKTLIVQETDADILDILSCCLEMEGYKVKQVLGYGADFLKLVAELAPALVLLDFRLDGIESSNICALIKTNFPWVKIIALSCNPLIGNLYLQSNFDGYLSKPFDIENLSELVERYS